MILDHEAEGNPYPSSLRELDHYPYGGHSRLMANVRDSWQDIDVGPPLSQLYMRRERGGNFGLR